MDVSIVIPVFNKSGLTRVCLSALRRTLPSDVTSEVIVIDNNSTDDTQAVLAEFPWIRVITNAENLGFAGGNNQGAAVASGRLLLLLNNDTEPQSGWMHALLRAAAEENVGVVGARLLFANRTLQHAGVVVSKERFGPYHYTPYHYLWSDPAEKPAAMQRKEFQIVTGACLMTPLALYRELGGLDELFWNGYEDVDYCFKVLARGKRVLYEPQAEIFHYESQSGPMRFSRVAYNSTLLARRWPDFPKIDHIQKYLSAGNIRRTNRVQNKFATVSMLAPKTTVLVHGDPGADAHTFSERLRDTLAPIERIIWTLAAPPPGFARVPVVHRPADPIEAAREEMKVRGDRYLAFVDAGCELNPNWLDKLLEEIEWASDVVAATSAPELPVDKEVTSLAADARCTVLALRNIPQHEVLSGAQTLNGAVADLTLRMLRYDFAIRAAAAGPAAHVPALADDAAFEAAHGAKIQEFLRDDAAYAEDALRKRTPRPVAELKASIVMLSWNAPQYTKIALESIRTHTKMPYEVIIVDNGSGTETTDWLRAQDGIEVVYNTANRGFAAGCNQGIAAASGDYVVLLNNDVVVTDGWLENLVDAVERDPATGVSAPRSNEIAGDQRLLDLNYSSIDEMHQIAQRRSVEHRRGGYFTDRAIGFCLCIDRTVLEQVGGIDESYGTGNFEDDDFCMRVRAAGYRIYVCNDVFIHHFGSVSFQTNSVDYASTMARNWSKFSAKWGYPAQYPQTGYDPQQAIRKGFDRSKHFVEIEGFGASSSPSEDQTAAQVDVRLLVAAAVVDEQDWTLVGNAVRRYLNAFRDGDSVAFAIACSGEMTAETVGARVEKMIEKAQIDPAHCADVLVSDEDDAVAWARTLHGDAQFEVTRRAGRLENFSPLEARSPSDLRRLYDKLDANVAQA